MKENVLYHISRGTTFTRAYLNREIFGHCHDLKGDILDLGSGGSEYYKYFGKESKVITSDIDPNKNANLIFDANEKFPIKNSSFDNIFCMNVVEHLNEPGNCINESYRILKSNGKMYLSAVFLYPFHGSPNDYFRYTHEGVAHLLRRAGFKKIYIKRVGGRGSVIVDTLVSLMPLKFLATLTRIIFYPIVWVLDDVIYRRIEKRIGKIYYLTSFIIAEK